MTVSEVAKALGISEGRVRQLIAEKTIKAERAGQRLLLVDRDDFGEYVSERDRGQHKPGRPRRQPEQED